MTIADTIYQHVKILPPAKALEVLHFVEFLESRSTSSIESKPNETLLSFLQNMPVGKRGDSEINTEFQITRDEWD